jgi:Flp pilus assembly pilin Flp
MRQGLLSNTRGAGLVEYGLVVGLVSVLAIGSVISTGGEVRDIFGVAQSRLFAVTDDPESLATAGGAEETAPATNPEADENCYTAPREPSAKPDGPDALAC